MPHAAQLQRHWVVFIVKRRFQLNAINIFSSTVYLGIQLHSI
jgi:hypothetical protein